MMHYKLKPKQDFLQSVGNLDIITEGHAVLGILADKDRFPEIRESIDEYIIRVPEQEVEFSLETELNGKIYEFLSKYWEIEPKFESDAVPPDIVEIGRRGWKEGTGYVILGGKNELVIHYLSEWHRFRFREEYLSEGMEIDETPIKSYEEFVKTAYAKYPKAVKKILQAAKEEPLKELEKLRNDFNSLLSKGVPSQKTIENYVSKVDSILRG